MFQKILKRDGVKADFDGRKITNAITKAGAATGEFDTAVAAKLTIKALSIAEQVRSVYG